MRFQFIEAEKANHRISILCRVLRVSRSGFYAWRRGGEGKRKQADRRLLVEVRAVFRQHRRRYGSPRIHRELRTDKRPVSRKRIARLMREAGLRARPQRRFRITTISSGEQPPASNLLARCFDVEEPNRVWAGDITYLRLRHGWLYLAVLLDLASRKVVGWSTRSDLSAELALGALEQALLLRQPARGLLHHSDQGVQYASEAYRGRLTASGIVQSMSRRGNCWDNAPVESFFSTLKTEIGCSSRAFDSREQARAEVADYIESYYNPIRTHSALGYLSPVEYEAKRTVR